MIAAVVITGLGTSMRHYASVSKAATTTGYDNYGFTGYPATAAPDLQLQMIHKMLRNCGAQKFINACSLLAAMETSQQSMGQHWQWLKSDRRRRCIYYKMQLMPPYQCWCCINTPDSQGGWQDLCKRHCEWHNRCSHIDFNWSWSTTPWQGKWIPQIMKKPPLAVF